MRLPLRCPQCGGAFEFGLKPPTAVVECPHCRAVNTVPVHTEAAEHRYRPRFATASLMAFIFTLTASVGVFFAVPRVEIESIVVTLLMTGAVLLLGCFIGVVLAFLALRKGEKPKRRAVVALVPNGLAFSVPALGVLRLLLMQLLSAL